jgi:hypothetical protein
MRLNQSDFFQYSQRGENLAGCYIRDNVPRAAPTEDGYSHAALCAVSGSLKMHAAHGLRLVAGRLPVRPMSADILHKIIR